MLFAFEKAKSYFSNFYFVSVHVAEQNGLSPAWFEPCVFPDTRIGFLVAWLYYHLAIHSLQVYVVSELGRQSYYVLQF